MSDDLSLLLPTKRKSASSNSSSSSHFDLDSDSDPDDPQNYNKFLRPLTMRRTLSTRKTENSLHFFVRTSSSRTLVIHSTGETTVETVCSWLETLTGVPAEQQRLIYSGRQLDGSSTLSDSLIVNDACVELVYRLRSTRLSSSWKLCVAIVDTIRNSLADFETIKSIIKDFLIMSRPDDAFDHLQVFIYSGAALAIVKLYLSEDENDKVVAENLIRLFFVADKEYLRESVHFHCVGVVMEFCKLLHGAGKWHDPLYIECRGICGSLLVQQDNSFFARSLTAKDLYPFVEELVGTLLDNISGDSVLVMNRDVNEFSQFLEAMRRAVEVSMGRDGPISFDMYNARNCLQYEAWVGKLHRKFLELLKRVNGFFDCMDAFLANEGMIPSEEKWGSWLQMLDILNEVNSLSTFYEGGQELLHSFLLPRRLSLNALLRRARRNEKLYWFLNHKDLTDFEARRNLVLMLYPEENDDFQDVHEMLIDRSRLLVESFQYIIQAEASSLHGKIFMEFKNEEATGPGVLREWFCLVCRAVFSSKHILFLPCPNDRRRFFPNPSSYVEPLYLKYFLFCGRLIALALMHKVHVGIVFDRVFFLQLAGKDITLEDIKDADPCFYKSCKKVLEMDANLIDADVLGLTFTSEIEVLGARKSTDLRDGGKDIIVNSTNRHEYVNLLVQHHFASSISLQISQFAQGFSDILSSPKHQTLFFKSLDLKDFDKMLGGSDSIISIRDWKAHTEYNGYEANDREICWFWKIVEGMSEEQQRVLLFFWTSVKFLPVEGFCGLASKLYIYRSEDFIDCLPSSHTCFYRLCLPPYSSITMMRDRLQLITLEHVSCSFGTW